MPRPLFKILGILIVLSQDAWAGQNPVDRLADYVSLSSSSLDEAGLQTCARRMAEDFKALNFETHYDHSRRALVGKRNMSSKKPHLLFVGHFDTVFSRDSKFRQLQNVSMNDSRAHHLKGFVNLVTGPGVADAKGGVVLMQELSAELSGHPITVFLSGDEEIGSTISKTALTQEAKLIQRTSPALGLVFEPGWFDSKLGRARLAAKVGGNLTVSISVAGLGGHIAVSPSNGLSPSDVFASIMMQLAKNRSPQFRIHSSSIDLDRTRRNEIAKQIKFKLNIRHLDSTEKVIERITQLLASIQNEFAEHHFSIEWSFDVAWSPHFTRPSQPLLRASQFLPSSTLTRSAASLLTEAGLETFDGMGPYGASYHSDQEVMALDSFEIQMARAHRIIQKLNQYHQ